MRHFVHLADSEVAHLFHAPPESFSPDDEPQRLSVALGATLYTPATRPTLAADLRKSSRRGLTSTVLCLEDAIADRDVTAAEANLIEQLREHARSGMPGPLVFVRVREAEQVDRVVDGLGEHAAAVSGFVFPKFDRARGEVFLTALAKAAARMGHRYLATPVLESADIARIETRTRVLQETFDLLDSHREDILAVRIGATDLCAAFGLRRPRELTIYDVHPVATIIADIVNVFGRGDGTGFTISGPVWEYFSTAERVFKPQLREAPFAVGHDLRWRKELIATQVDGLIREAFLDQAQGLTGKTVIHPTHVPVVNVLSIVPHEEFVDAQAILDTEEAGGVSRSDYLNKMNESKPHQAWARRVVQRADLFGVAKDGVSIADLLRTIVAR